MTSTQPTPEEQVRAQRIAELILKNGSFGDRSAKALAAAYLALLTQQSQERAEIKRLNRALFVAGKRITDSEAELDRAVEREADALTRLETAVAMAQGLPSEPMIRSLAESIANALAASPGKGAEGGAR